jgi:hypothetical protein
MPTAGVVVSGRLGPTIAGGNVGFGWGKSVVYGSDWPLAGAGVASTLNVKGPVKVGVSTPSAERPLG